MKNSTLNKILRYLALFFCGYFIVSYGYKLVNGEKALNSWVDYLFFLGSIGYYVIEFLGYQEKNTKSNKEENDI